VKAWLSYLHMLAIFGFPLGYVGTLLWNLYAAWWIGLTWPPWWQFVVMLVCSTGVAMLIVHVLLNALHGWWVRRPPKNDAIGRWLEKWIGGK
jgi:TRAP-type C4-dicarboxylate transport system permease small subunit